LRERRKKPRYQVDTYLTLLNRADNSQIGRVVDISPDGIRLSGQIELSPDTSYGFLMKLPTYSYGSREIEFKASVRWTRSIDHTDYYESGLLIHDLKEEDRKLIDQFIQFSIFENDWLLTPSRYTD
jgi:hypothetical protein